MAVSVLEVKFELKLESLFRRGLTTTLSSLSPTPILDLLPNSNTTTKMMQPSKPPPPHVSPPGMWGSKLALRILQFILALSIIGCAGSTISTAAYLFGVENGLSLLLVAPQAIVSAVWSLSDGICILARGGRRGIHPGANVALDLLLWMCCMVGVVIVSVFGITSAKYYLTVIDFRVNRHGIRYEAQRPSTTAAVAMGQAMVGLGATLAWVISPFNAHSSWWPWLGTMFS